MQASHETLSDFRIILNSRWGGGRVHSRDKAWLEFVPSGGTAPEGHMFQAVTELDMSDAEVVAAVQARIALDWRAATYEGTDLSLFDVYSVYRTTCG
jgi:hypothetical protein